MLVTFYILHLQLTFKCVYLHHQTITDMKILEIGQTIEVVRIATDAMYVKAKGIITDIKPNGTIWMDATMVVSRFDKKGSAYSQHPTSCAIAVSQSEIIN